jgi:hypothetical protein
MCDTGSRGDSWRDKDAARSSWCHCGGWGSGNAVFVKAIRPDQSSHWSAFAAPSHDDRLWHGSGGIVIIVVIIL